MGYGDYSPQYQSTRLIAVFYLPYCVAAMTQVLGKLSGIYVKRKAEASEKEFLNRSLTAKDIKEMDDSGDGKVSYDEFLTFMLVTMGKVEISDIQQIESLYEKLDKDKSKSLDIHDLVSLAYGPSNSTYEIVQSTYEIV